MRARHTSLSTIPVPPENAPRSRFEEISEDTDVSKIHRIRGSSTNISTPLMRCRMDTQPAAGSRYLGRSLKALMLRNSGRCLASSVMGSFFLGGESRGRTTQNSIATKQSATQAWRPPLPAALAQFIAVVVRVGAIEPASQLHRYVVVRIGKPLHGQQRRALGEREQPRLLAVGGDGADLLFGAHHAHAELQFEQGIGRSLVRGELFGRESLERIPGQPHVF